MLVKWSTLNSHKLRTHLNCFDAPTRNFKAPHERNEWNHPNEKETLS